MARRRGSLLLFAFLMAIIVSGGGGVRAPWSPRPGDAVPVAITIAHLPIIDVGSSRYGPRME